MPDTKAKLNRCRKLLLKPKDTDRTKVAPKCRNCMFYQPDFRYRKCLYSVCPLGKNSKAVFRGNPLSEERIIPKKKLASDPQRAFMKEKDILEKKDGMEKERGNV